MTSIGKKVLDTLLRYMIHRGKSAGGVTWIKQGFQVESSREFSAGKNEHCSEL